MKRLGKMTRTAPGEVVDKAISYFGSDGLGLEVSERSAGRVVLTGGGGLVEVSAEERGNKTEVDIIAREWDHAAMTFLGKI